MFLILLILALTLRALVVEPFFVPSTSMSPTLAVNDQLLVDKVLWRRCGVQLGDIVVFCLPAAERVSDPSGEPMIKRVVALEDDVVEVKRGILLVNGVAQHEPFVKEPMQYSLAPVRVPRGCVFVLGDNRNNSLDSHIWGFLDGERLIGRAVVRYWPPRRIGAVTQRPAAPTSL